MQMQGAAAGPRAAHAGSALLSATTVLLARLNTTITACTEHLTRFRFNDAAHELTTSCGTVLRLVLEYSKDVLYGSDQARREQVLAIMRHAVSNASDSCILHALSPRALARAGYGLTTRHHECRWPTACAGPTGGVGVRTSRELRGRQA